MRLPCCVPAWSTCGVTSERTAAAVCQLPLSGGWHRPGVEGLAGRLPRLVFLRSSELGAGVFNEVTYQDDIVEQLRRAATFSMIAGNRQMLEKAAAEIERLRLSSASAVSVAGNLRNGALSGCETVRSEPEAG